jgi:hypothetical protein
MSDKEVIRKFLNFADQMVDEIEAGKKGSDAHQAYDLRRELANLFLRLSACWFELTMARTKTAQMLGEIQGGRVRNLPDDYLSWLYDQDLKDDFEWLHRSVMELGSKNSVCSRAGRKLCTD